MRITYKLLIIFLGYFLIFFPLGTDVKYCLFEKSNTIEDSLRAFCNVDYHTSPIPKKETESKAPTTPSPTPKPTPKPIIDITPQIEAMSYNTECLVINQETTFTQVISETKHKEKERNYFIEIYSSRPFGDFLLAENTACIPKGKTKVQIDNKFSFDTPGVLNTLIKIYDKKGGTLLLEEISTRQRTVEYILTSDTQLHGVDLFSTVNKTAAKAIKAAGYSFVVRYYSKNEGKRIYREEALNIKNAGLQLVTIYQDANHTYDCFTYENGYSECMNAIKQAIEIGQPVTTPIYFTVDLNADPSSINMVYDYFTGVNAAMADFSKTDSLKRSWKIGGYGSYFVVKSLDEQKLVSYLWQTLAWSDNQHYNYHFYQNEHDKTVAGLQVDTNYSSPNKNNDVGGYFVKSNLSN